MPDWLEDAEHALQEVHRSKLSEVITELRNYMIQRNGSEAKKVDLNSKQNNQYNYCIMKDSMIFAKVVDDFK